MIFDRAEILETLRMLEIENLDVRTVTLGISILDCRGKDFEETVQRVVAKIRRYAASLNAVADEVSAKYGIPIVNRRVAISPVALLLTGEEGEGVLDFAKALDDLARELAIDFIGGFSALVHKGATKGDILLMESLPSVLSGTERICASVNVASSRTGINVDAILTMAQVVKETAERTKDRDGIGCAKLVVFANAPEDNPFMAGAFHGVGEGLSLIHI